VTRASGIARRSPHSLTCWRWDLVLGGFVLAVGGVLKRHYSTASADELGYVLAPTAALVRLVTGAGVVAEAGAGYLSQELSILIAPSCAGVNFLVMAWCMLGLGFVRQVSAPRTKLAWLALSAALAYTTTVMVNATRIVVGAVLESARWDWTLLPPEQIHRVEGVVVYLTALLVLFSLATRVVRRWTA
jgi:exosortase K